jgi:hypothetical protein
VNARTKRCTASIAWSRFAVLGPVPGTNRPLVGIAALSASRPASTPYFASNLTSCSVSPGRVPRFAITQRPSFVCTIDGCGVTPSRA